MNIIKKFLAILCFSLLSLGLIFWFTSIKSTPASKVEIPIVAEKAWEGTMSVNTNNVLHPTLKYYYYIPKNINYKNQKLSALVLVPGYNGEGKDFVYPEFKNFAQEQNLIIIAPSFKANGAEVQTSTGYHHPHVWSGRAFLNILKNLKLYNFEINKLYLFGFSAGAQFVERFSLWYPEICTAVATHAAGDYTYPTVYNPVKYFVTVGTSDEQFRQENYHNLIKSAKDLNISVEYKTYPVGHGISKDQVRDSIEFFKKYN